MHRLIVSIGCYGGNSCSGGETVRGISPEGAREKDGGGNMHCTKAGLGYYVYTHAL